MDGLTFHKILRILNSGLAGATLNNLSVLGSQLFINMYCDGPVVLRFSSNPPPVLEKVNVAAGESPSALSALNGASVADISGRAYDRVGWIDFNKRRPSGRILQYRLVLEPMGNYANAFLLNNDGVILYRLTHKSIDPDRDIGIGKQYELPRQNKKFNLSNTGDAGSFLDLVGFYPLTAAAAGDYTPANIKKILTDLNSNDYFYRLHNGKIIPFKTNDAKEEITFDNLVFGNSSVAPDRDIELTARLKKFYNKEYEHYTKVLDKLNNELLAAQGWEAVKGEADLLKNNIHIVKGVGVYDLVEYSATGENIVHYNYSSDMPLHKYIDSLYKRASRLSRSLPFIQERIGEVEQLAQSAIEQLYYIDKADTYELRELAEVLKKRPLINTNKSKNKDYHEFIYNGANIYIGRNSISNHRLVFRFANPGDTWLHAHNIPSAHCIIRFDGELSADTLNFAASLVAYYSKNKNEKTVSVDYTLRKYVKKPKNTPPGFVTYINFKTIDIQPVTEDFINKNIVK